MRKKPLTDIEIQTCEKILELRLALRIDQTAFAKCLNISRASLLNREKKIAPWADIELLRCIEFTEEIELRACCGKSILTALFNKSLPPFQRS